MGSIAAIKTFLLKMIWIFGALPATNIGNLAGHNILINQMSTDERHAIQWYQAWNPYLHYNLQLIHTVWGSMMNGLIKGLYHLNVVVQSIFDSMFSLMGWDGTLSASGSPLHGLYMVIWVIGWALLGLSLIVVVWQSLGHAVKWGKVLPNVMLVALTITVLPMVMRTAGSSTTPANKNAGIGDIVVGAKNDVEGTKTKGSNTTNLAAEPIHNNVVDLARIAAGGWDMDPKRLDIPTTNNLTGPKAIDALNLGQTMDKDLEKEFNLTDSKSQPHGFSTPSQPFEYQFMDDSNVAGTNQSPSMLFVKRSTPTGLGTANDSGYTRYSVNWVPLIGQSIILWVILMIAAFRVAKDIFELTNMNLIAPVLAFQSVKSSKKIRDLVNSIIGLYFSLVLMFVVIKVFFVFIGVVPSKLPKSLTGMSLGVATMIIYAAGGYALFAGVSYFERVTGVSQGFADETGHIGSTIMGAYGATRMAQMAIGGAGMGMSKLRNHSTSNSTGISTSSLQSSAATSTSNYQQGGLSGMANTTGGSSTRTMGSNNSQNTSNSQSHGLSRSSDQQRSDSNSNGGNHSTEVQGGQNSQQSNQQDHTAENQNNFNQQDEHNQSNPENSSSLQSSNSGTSVEHGSLSNNPNLTSPNAQGIDMSANDHHAGVSGSHIVGASTPSSISGREGVNESMPTVPPSQENLLENRIPRPGTNTMRSGEGLRPSRANANDSRSQNSSGLSGHPHTNTAQQANLNPKSGGSAYGKRPDLQTNTNRSDTGRSSSNPRTAGTATTRSLGGSSVDSNGQSKAPETFSQKMYEGGKRGTNTARNYQHNHNYGMSQRGHVNGVDSPTDED